MNNSRINSLFVFVVVLLASASCTGMFDNVREFATEETVYAGKLDGIQHVYYGYERVEIDLMEAGRIKESQMNLGRATKTVVECPYFEETDHRRVIDTLASWVNITGLTRADTYDFTIYTEDDYGNRSLPITTQIQPFTSENLKALALAQPSLAESDVAIQLEWREHQSNVTYTMYGYSYSYTDKDGVVQSGSGEGDMPVFLVDNIEKDKDVTVNITCDIVPNFMTAKGVYTPLLDRVQWNTTVDLRISPDAGAAIFLKSPEPALSFDFDTQTYPIAFSWTEVPAATGYNLKLSTTSLFEDSNTITIPVGKVTEYNITKESFNELLSRGRKVRKTELFWTVEAIGVSDVKTQTRMLNVTRKPVLIGSWTFDDPGNLLKASVGNDLTALGSKSVMTIDGPTPNSGAAEISSGTYLRLKHGLSEGTSDFTISMYVNSPYAGYHPLVNFNQGDGDPAEFAIDANCALSFATGDVSGQLYGATYETWHILTLTVSNGAMTAWMDGYQVLSASSSSDRYKLSEKYMTLFADGGGTKAYRTLISDLAMWDMPLEQEEILEHYKLRKVDPLECSIKSFSTEADTSPEVIINGGLNGTAYYGKCDPLFAVIDMGSKRNLGYIVVCGYIWSSDDAKFFDISISDSGQAYAQFTPLGTIATPRGGWSRGTFYTLDLSESNAQGRYLKVLGREPWSQYILMSEVLMYEIIE